MTNIVVDFIQATLDLRQTIDNLLTGPSDMQFASYTKAKLEAFAKAAAVQQEWMKADFNSATSQLLLKVPTMRTLVGPFSDFHQMVAEQVPDLRKGSENFEAMAVAFGKNASPESVHSEAQMLDSRLLAVAESKEVMAVIGAEAPSIQSSLSTRYLSKNI